MKEPRKDIPEMKGNSVDDKLANLVQWRNKTLKNGDCLKLVEIGDAIGLSRERVRQIEAGALRKLRHPVLINQLER
jgi:DNA-directed RNA polymerase sigma subunit (sigma70/sigma32)